MAVSRVWDSPTCQIIELLGSQGWRQSPAGPLDAHVGGGTFDQSGPHDQAVQGGEEQRNLTVGHQTPPPTFKDIKPLWLKFSPAIFQLGVTCSQRFLGVVV